MNLKIDPEWLRRMAEKEGNGIVSVGGLVSRLESESGMGMYVFAYTDPVTGKVVIRISPDWPGEVAGFPLTDEIRRQVDETGHWLEGGPSLVIVKEGEWDQ